MSMVDSLTSFLLYTGTGMIGAALYLLLILITDHDIHVLRNNIVPHLPLMTGLYIAAGGVFASIVQLSTGSLFALSNLQTVLLLGFGWQGALSGVGVASKVAKAKDDADQAWNQVAETIAISKKNELEAIKKFLLSNLAKGSPSP